MRRCQLAVEMGEKQVKASEEQEQEQVEEEKEEDVSPCGVDGEADTGGDEGRGRGGGGKKIEEEQVSPGCRDVEEAGTGNEEE